MWWVWVGEVFYYREVGRVVCRGEGFSGRENVRLDRRWFEL